MITDRIRDPALNTTYPTVAAGESGLPVRLRGLVSPFGGLIGEAVWLPAPAGVPDYNLSMATLGDLSYPLPGVSGWASGESFRGRADGAGGSVDASVAEWLCIAEAVERYCTFTFAEEQFIWATATELGDDALDLDRLPRLSRREYADPHCLLVPPDKDAPLRWVRGLSLATGRRIWIPAIIVYLGMPFGAHGERIAVPISTGCAAHTDPATATARALAEVIERDAISLTWLQRLELPRIELDVVPDHLAPYLERAARAGVQTAFFDATTDLGIPTVYSVHVAPYHRTLRTVVMCATEPAPAVATGKVLREYVSCLRAMEDRESPPTDPYDCVELHHGAMFMSRPDRAPAFGFLLDSPRRVSLSQLPKFDFESGAAHLRFLLDRLASKNMEAFAVDLTTDESDRVGVTVVRVVVPDLQPLSPIYRAQFRGHPRLYDAPRAMGHVVHPEEDLNPWPQPFA